jgi:hypothetical protein
MEDWQQYYAAQSIVTDPAPYQGFYEALPAGIPSLCRVVQGLVLHLHWAERYGVALPDARKTEVRLRRADRQIARLLELSDAPLTEPRPLDKKIVGTCRDYAALLVSFLRHQGVSARMRVGFATYFTPGHFEDHYLCQYWHAAENRWVLVDAQLDDFQRQALNIGFDPYDLPEGLFLPGGKAWQVCREGRFDPELFGIFDVRNMWFIGCDTIYDALALNKLESHPWDIWPMMPKYQQTDFSEAYLRDMDHIAALTGTLDPAFAPVRLLYQTDSRLQPSPGWKL